MVPPWRQELGGAYGFEYVGGSICDDENVTQRLNEWAFAVFNSLPRKNSRGWISLDAIVAAPEIYLIEVNPRITERIWLLMACQQQLATG